MAGDEKTGPGRRVRVTAANPRAGAGPKTRIRVRLLDVDGKPISRAACTLVWGGQTINAPDTNADGIFEADVPSSATSGFLSVEALGSGNTIEVKLELDDFGAADLPAGMRARLINLGYMPVADLRKPSIDDEDRQALARFRSANRIVDANGVPTGATGLPNDATTKTRLEDAHDTDKGKLVP